MAWRVIGIENPAKLSVRDNKLVVLQEQEVLIPIEDIDALVIDNYATTLSTKLITELATNNTTVVICDEKHLPTSVVLPYSQHSRQAKISREQIAMKLPLKKQLWQSIIVQKITNQAAVLQQFDYDNFALLELAASVRSGDSTNRESIAARLYFSILLDDTTRRKPMWHNAALNYGYAIVRGHIARHIAARGLVASQGIFHRSELNGFNLADDLIEPYRPAVDYYVLSIVASRHIGESDTSLTKEDRQLLVDILNGSVIIAGKKFTIKHAVERTIESFVQSIETGEGSSLLLPSIVSK